MGHYDRLSQTENDRWISLTRPSLGLPVVSATLSWLAATGFVFSFGIFFPVFMDYFNESREKTGKLSSEQPIYPRNIVSVFSIRFTFLPCSQGRQDIGDVHYCC